MLQVEHVSKYYGSHCALKDVSLEVPEGSIFGLLGPNGAGKTSLIRIINQITGPDSGRILLNGKELQAEDISRIGYLPEERGLYPKMRVEEQVLYLSRLKGLDKAEAKKRIRYWFERFEIDSWKNKNIEELSKGMAQKVQFIATVIHKPDLLIFDEPFTGFDPINTNLIKNEILELKKNGATVIFSTHRMDSVEEICDRIALINRSEKILEGELYKLRQSYKSNIYRVEMDGNPETFQTPARAELLDHTRSEFGYLYRFSLPDESSNELLSECMQQGQIISFREELPSLNDIFIHKVNNHE